VSIFSQIPFTIPEILLISLLYLLLDLYPQVKSFRATLSTTSFLLLWGMFSILTGIAYFFLMTTSSTSIQSMVGPVGTKLTVIILASLMGVTVLQSLSLKVSEVKILNLEALLNSYRGQVLADITKRNARNERLRAMRLEDRLAEKFRNRGEELLGRYAALLLYKGQNAVDAAKVLAALHKEAQNLNIPEALLVAGRIVRLDPERAEHWMSRDERPSSSPNSQRD
jgi:hypothetical protein